MVWEFSLHRSEILPYFSFYPFAHRLFRHKSKLESQDGVVGGPPHTVGLLVPLGLKDSNVSTQHRGYPESEKNRVKIGINMRIRDRLRFRDLSLTLTSHSSTG